MKTPAFGALRVEELPWRRILLFALLGALSGALSAFTAFLVFPPGFIFGVVFTPLLVRRGLLSPLRALPWLACATFGHLVAADSLTDVSGWLHAFSPIPEPPAIMLAGLVAGALGGGVLAAATRLLIPGTRWLIPTSEGRQGATRALLRSGQGCGPRQIRRGAPEQPLHAKHLPSASSAQLSLRAARRALQGPRRRLAHDPEKWFSPPR